MAIMLRAVVAVVLSLMLAACVCGDFLDDGPEQRGGPYEQAMLQRLQSYLDATEEGRGGFQGGAALLPAKRQAQMRYNQCYFNPISCFKRRK